MIHRQARAALPAVLAGIVITAQNLPFCEAHARARSRHHVGEPNDRRAQEDGGGGVDNTTPVEDDLCFVHHQQAHRTFGVTDV